MSESRAVPGPHLRPLAPPTASCTASKRASSSSSKPMQADVETLVLKCREFDAKQFVVPAARSSASWLSAMMYARFCASVRWSSTMTGTSVSPQLPRGEEAAVTGDDASLGVHQNRVVETELGDAGGDLRDLRVRVGARISRKRNELFDCPIHDALRYGERKHTRTFRKSNLEGSFRRVRFALACRTEPLISILRRDADLYECFFF